MEEDGVVFIILCSCLNLGIFYHIFLTRAFEISVVE